MPDRGSLRPFATVEPGNANFREQGSSTRGRTTRTPMTQVAETPKDEKAKVESWRLHVLMEAGYPLPLAEKIAHSEADLHHAADLLAQGCSPETAAEILI